MEKTKEKEILKVLREVRQMLEQQSKLLSLILFSSQQEHTPDEDNDNIEIEDKEDKLTDWERVEPFKSYIG